MKKRMAQLFCRYWKVATWFLFLFLLFFMDGIQDGWKMWFFQEGVPITWDREKEKEKEKASDYWVEDGTEIPKGVIDGKIELPETDFSGTDPEILIFSTHGSELYCDGKSVLDVGEKFSQFLANSYGLDIVRSAAVFDTQRETSYETMGKEISRILEKYPSIQVVIDIHRDASNPTVVTDNNGQDVEREAKLMLVNGVCTGENSPQNPYVQQNIAFSRKCYASAQTRYPGLMKKVYIKPYRYSTYFRPLSLLVEVGDENNTSLEAEQSLEKMGEILMDALNRLGK
ncbi:MAG: stage II sporulation protein P [Clostridiales bacterium]|nr:stage II sporulation protein P [Clostridiales bacterium]